MLERTAFTVADIVPINLDSVLTEFFVFSIVHDVKPPQIIASWLYEQKPRLKQQQFFSWPPISHLPDRLVKQGGYTKHMKLVVDAKPSSFLQQKNRYETLLTFLITQRESDATGCDIALYAPSAND